MSEKTPGDTVLETCKGDGFCVKPVKMSADMADVIGASVLEAHAAKFVLTPDVLELIGDMLSCEDYEGQQLAIVNAVQRRIEERE